MVAGGMKLIKYLMFFFNFIFFVAGIALIAIGAIVKSSMKDYLKLLDSSFSTPPILCIIVGVVIAMIAFFGCCGAFKENYCMTMTFAVLMCIILILELAAGILAYTLKDKVGKYLEENSLKAIKHYGEKGADSEEMTKAIDDIQMNFHCCGYNNYTDYNATNVPSTCCKKEFRKKSDCGSNPANLMENGQGCKDGVMSFVKKHIEWIGGIGIAIAVIQILGIIFACCLAKTIKSEGQYA